MNGLTQDESAALLGVREVLRNYVEHLCGDLKYRDAWRKYGAFNSTTQDFEFYPGWFLGPLQMMLEFQSALVHTQMFVSYIDRRRAEDLEVGKQRLRAQAFIGSFNWVHRRRREARRGRRRHHHRLLLEEDEEGDDEDDHQREDYDDEEGDEDDDHHGHHHGHH